MVPPRALPTARSIAETSSQSVTGVAPAADPTLNRFFLETVLEFALSVVFLGIIGWIVLGVAPKFTDNGVRYVYTHPGEAFLYGLLAIVIVFGATVLLAITVIGLVIVIPGLIVLAILGFGGMTVAIISLGVWVRSSLEFGIGGIDGKYETSLLVGVVAWVAIDMVPVLGGLVTFVIGTMGFGYLALWLTSDQLDRDYGSFDPDGSPPPFGENDEGDVRHGSHDDPDETGDMRAGSKRGTDPGRFRNLAAQDAERENQDDEDTYERRTGAHEGRKEDETSRKQPSGSKHVPADDDQNDRNQ